MKRITRVLLLMLSTCIVLWAYDASGHHLWPGYYLPIEYHVHNAGAPGNDCPGDSEFEAIRNAFATWQDVSTSWVTFDEGNTVSYLPILGDGENTIGWVTEDWMLLFEEWWWIAAARTWAPPPSGGDTLIEEADIHFNAEYFSWTTNGASGCYDVENVAAHEIGHWLRLGDVLGAPFMRTMYGEESAPGQTWRRTLYSDDIAGASFLYPYQTDWPPQMHPIYNDELHTYFIDVALSWDPTDKDEYLHAACQEGYSFGGGLENLPENAEPLDRPVSPVRVVYSNNEQGWLMRDVLSGYHTRIYGPKLEIDEEDELHII